MMLVMNLKLLELSMYYHRISVTFPSGITNMGTVTLKPETGLSNPTWEYSVDFGSTWTKGTITNVGAIKSRNFTLSDGEYPQNKIQIRHSIKVGSTFLKSAGITNTSKITVDTKDPLLF